MKNRNDFELIKNTFEEENITAPRAVSEDAVMDMLKGKEQKKIRFYQTRIFKSLISTAACIAVIITSVAVSKFYISDNGENINQPSQKQVLNTFSSINEIKSAVKRIELQNSEIKGIAEDSALPETYNDLSTGAVSYAETYKQVDTVDEGDILKNDGRYIYFMDSTSGIIKIFNSDSEMISTIDEFEYDNSDFPKENYYIIDMYIYNNFLAVNAEKYIYENEKDGQQTCTYIYDVSDITHPKKTNSFSQSGNYTSSRMIDSQLYVVSNDYIYTNQCKDDSDYIPYVCEGENGKHTPVNLDDICYCENFNTASYLVISSIDIATGEKSSDTKALFGVGTDIYCNEKNMYVCMDETNMFYLRNRMEDINNKICIVKISLDKNDIQFTATGKVSGTVNDQFSMDEKDGYLRIATTSYDKSGQEINNLFILDEKLEKIGEVTGFAKNESIKAVRFIGSMAYVITYEQTDPLFVIDLSDPKKPQIKGEVKITGFSSLLVPVDDKMLLGIGYSTEDAGEMEMTNGIKLALFDISNPENPQVLDSSVIKNAYSDAQYNHHALAVNKKKGYYAIPYNSNNGDEKGAVTFKIQNKKIVITNDFKTPLKNYADILRCTYINDTMYLLSSNAEIYSFTIN